MARKPLQLGRPDVAESIDELHRNEPPGWRKDRLLVIKLVARGDLTAAKIADLVCARPASLLPGALGERE
jgi:hypothetical protein